MGERVAHADGFIFSQSREVRKDSYGMISLAVWRETLMIHARGFIFSQRHKGRKGFLRNVGLGGLGGLARDINDSRTRIYILAKAQRTQRIPTECWTWRLGERWFMQIFCSRKGAEDAKDSYGMSDLADLAAWRETLMIHTRGLFSRKGAKDAKDSIG